MKMVKLLSATHKRLSVAKAELELNTFSEVIDYLLGLYDGRQREA